LTESTCHRGGDTDVPRLGGLEAGVVPVPVQKGVLRRDESDVRHDRDNFGQQ
jgi:hypothetical protein